jgi:hypothetical protein
MPDVLLEIGPDSGDLPIPALAPGQEWASARLRISAPPTVTLTPTLEAPGDPTAGVPWIGLRWSAMRPLIAAAVTWAAAPPAQSFMLLKVATGGVWFTPVPPGRVHPRTFQPLFACPTARDPAFPPVLASALLLELRAGDPFKLDSGEPDEALGRVLAVAVTVQNPVYDLSVAVGGSAPVLQQRGRLAGPVELDLLPALRAAPPGAALRLRASTTADVTVTWAPQALTRPAAAPHEPATQAAALGETVRWTQPLADEPVRAASGRLVWTGAPERCLRGPAGAPDPTLAQAVYPGLDAAQALGPLAGPATGVDLWIAARTACAGALRLVGERAERPADRPLAETSWSLAAGESRWISLPLPPAARGPLWLVCSAHEGDALIPRAALQDDPPALQRRNHGAWDALDDPSTRPSLHLRVRAPLPGRPAVPVRVRRGDITVDLTSDGPFDLTPEQLARLNTTSGPVQVALTAPGAGAVTLAAWDLRLA